MYTSRIAQHILIKLHERQWNPYLSNHIMTLGRDAIIRQGPALRLQVKGAYTLFPRISNSNNPQDVIGALDLLVTRLTEPERARLQDKNLPAILPSITLQGQQHTLEGFRFHSESVKTYTPTGLVVPYEDFLTALTTLVRGVV
ncbi:MAG: hypothetical protein Q8L34_01060 [Candidatus Woesearchaeota archaeon]|nr:hypothetical protein [Candidatus Woesearchaeota archaeon]